MPKKCRCGKPAVIFRKYEGRALCEYHFCQSIEEKAKKTIRKAKMIKPNDKIIVGLSGGKDSGAILYIMNKIFSQRPDIELMALSIDEGVKGSRDKALKKAKEFCKKINIKQHVFSFKKIFGKTMDQIVKEIKKKKLKIGEPCTHCGVGRRYILNKFARELGGTKLCLGHNLDDEVQAILMNYVRGDLPRAARSGPITNWSISKMKEKLFIPRIKPLREIPEEEIELYAKIKKIPAYFKVCPYKSGLRVPVLEFVDNLEDKYPGIKFTILHTFDRMLPAIRDLVDKEKTELKICKKCGEPGSKNICKTCELWGS